MAQGWGEANQAGPFLRKEFEHLAGLVETDLVLRAYEDAPCQICGVAEETRFFHKGREHLVVCEEDASTLPNEFCGCDCGGS